MVRGKKAGSFDGPDREAEGVRPTAGGRGVTRAPVRSSTLVSVGYDDHKQVLEIEFRQNAVYQYLGVPKPLYEQLMSAASKGSFFDRRIRDRFRTLKLS